MDDGSVLTMQRHNIRHSSQCCHIRRTADLRHIPAEAAGKRRHRLERQPGAAEVTEGIGLILPPGIYYCIGRRKRGPGLVVVGDQHIHAQLIGSLDAVKSNDAVIDGQYNPGLRPALHNLFHAVGAHAKPVHEPVVCVEFNIAAHAPKIFNHDGAATDAIHIIIVINDDFLMAIQSSAQPFHQLVHIFQPNSLNHGGEVGEEKVRDFSCCLKATVRQNLQNQRLRSGENGIAQPF